MSQSQLSKESAAMLAAFRTQQGVTDIHYRNLINIVTSSPLLTERLNLAVANKHISGLEPLNQANAGGTFDPSTKTISLPLDSLATSDSRNNMIFVLAHEIQHSFNYQKTDQATQKFLNDAETQARQKGIRDYTDEIKALIMANRQDEASAEIAGFNAVVSKVRQTNPNPTLKDLYNTTSYAKDFIKKDYKDSQEVYTLKPHLTLNKDMTLSETPGNLEAMGVHYFDKSPEQTRLGYRGTSDYANYYATWAVGNAVSFERAYNPKSQEPLVLDMTGLRLQEKILEENGLHTGNQPMNYKDIGRNPPFVGRFDHTYDGRNQYTWVPVAYENSMPATAEKDPLQARLDALLGRLDRAIDAYGRNDNEAIRASNEEMIAASPKVRQMFETAMAEAALEKLHREAENRRFSLENMPQRAQLLHAQIDKGLRDFYQENNLPYTEREMKNSVAALTAEAYANRMPEIQRVGINKNGELFAWHETAYHYATHALTDSAKAAATPPQESFAKTLEAEQTLAEQDRRREYERQMEQQRSYGMSR